jgi:hypothetical protein
VAEPPPATGIDYLRLVEARADAELAQRTSYAGIAGSDQPMLPGTDWDQIGSATLTTPGQQPANDDDEEAR